MRLSLVLLGSLLSGLAMNAAAAPQEEGKRVALVIGNDAYLTRPLQNAVNDARLMDKVLKASGFQTILKENAKKAEMEEALAEFLGQLGPNDTALFYYAGHGVQIENENLLVPVDFEPGSTITLSKFRCFPFNLVIESLKRVRHKRSIFILDACRSNPLTESQSLQAGLAIPPDAGGDTLVIYSTNANNVAADNPGGRDSYFTEALADLIAQPGLPISDIVARVTKRVLEETDNRQNPTIFGSPTSRFYFHPPSNLDTESDPTLVEKWMEDAKLREQREDWQQSIDLVNQVVKKKPGGNLEETAKARLPYLEARRDAQSRFEAADYKAAARLYDQAYHLDLFAIDAAFRGVDSNLLDDRLDEAVRLLKAIRVRGTTAQIRKADAMLKELAAVYPEAGKELQSPPPQPPPISEIFSGVHFGAPDFEAGRRFQAATPVDLSRWVKELSVAATPPPTVPVSAVTAPVPAVSAASPPPGAAVPNFFHVEVITSSNSRDLMIRKTGGAKVNISNVRRPTGVPVKVTTDPPGANLSVDGDPEQRCQSPCILTLNATKQTIHADLEGFRPALGTLVVKPSGDELQLRLEQETGFLEFEGGTGETPVVVDGKVMAKQVPVKLEVPVGKYEVRTVENGKILAEQDVEVKPLSTVGMKVSKQVQ
jgi:tetratricopeptide (TPR) repeat protein